MKIIIFIISLIALSKTFFTGEKQKDGDNYVADQFEGTYIVKSFAQTSDYAYQGSLEYQGNLDTFLADNNPVIKNLDIILTLNCNNELTFQIQPSEGVFFALPQKEPFPHEKNTEGTDSSVVYTVKYPEVGKQFGFQVLFGDVIVFDTTGQEFVFSKLFVAFGNNVYGEDIWGWGEQRGVWLLENGAYSIWNSDRPFSMTTGVPGDQTYGSHPVWMERSNVNQEGKKVDDKYFMVYLRSTYGLQLNYEQNNYMKIQMNGGPIELKFFMYKTPKQNIKAYSKYVNGWSLPPFWSLGFHMCRYGWKDSEEWVSIWETANKDAVGLDTMWTDIDYMQDYEDFTIGQKWNVNQMKEVTNLEDPMGVHFVPIIDAGVGMKSGSGKTGENKDLFIKSAKTKESLIGCVWPGAAYFVDWNNPLSEQFWINGLKNITEVYNGPQPSGIWLDMNEVSSFTYKLGEVTNPDDCEDITNNKNGKKFQLAKDYFNQKLRNIRGKYSSRNGDDWGYPWSANGKNSLQFRTISTDAIHYNKKDSVYVNIENYEITEYEFHNLYGMLEGIATNKYLKEVGNKLPFIISRASVPGQGKYTQLWTGDSNTNWEQMQKSLGDIFAFQLFQIPMVGNDVCGFGGQEGEATPELCARWYQLGAFYPFYRSHTDNNSTDHYPWSYPDYPYVLDSTKKSINLRYSLLKWYYSIFVREQPHGTLFSPLWFDYPNEEMAQKEAHQALIGSEIMITPVLDETDTPDLQTSTIKVYFPGDVNTIWYRYQDNTQFFSGGVVGEFSVPFDTSCPFFIKSGSVVVQQPQYLNVDYSQKSRYLDNTFELLVALDNDFEANGTLLSVTDYEQDSIVENCLGSGKNCLLNIKVREINSQPQKTIRIEIIPKNNSTVYTGEVNISSLRLLNTGETYGVDFTFDSENTSYLIAIF